ncbi:MAG TPA: hypothetical protein PK668_05080 [Myxococcota bacterium]|nr:hypothetical protein [Myxococcota bacterium]HRY92231.1 hypothetical protein [Myxococcota bacterium]
MTRPRTYFEDLPALHLEDVRRQVGGRRKLAAASSVTVLLPEGREVQITIARRPGVLGGEELLFACPTCGRPCRVLRIVQHGPGLTCTRCLQVACAAKYRSQVLQRTVASPAA